MRVENIESDGRYSLISDSQDILATVQHFFSNQQIEDLEILEDIGCIFAEVLDGEYGNVYFSPYSTPWLTAPLYDLREYFK